MKALLNLICICTVVALAGCDRNHNNNGSKSGTNTNLGAMKECTKCGTNCDCRCCKVNGRNLGTASAPKCCCPAGTVCCKDKNSTNMGAVGEKKSGGCCAEKKDASMGAVGEKTECQKVCPMSGKTNETVSPGAVGEKKSGCCAGKSSCTSARTGG